MTFSDIVNPLIFYFTKAGKKYQAQSVVVVDADGNVSEGSGGTVEISGAVELATQGYSAKVSFARTSDTNAYLAGDVLGSATGSTAALTFANVGPAAGGEVVVTSVALETDAAALISGESGYRLYLYNVTPPSALGDNAAWDLPSGDRASFLGYIDLGTPVDIGSTCFVQTESVNKQITLAGANVYGYLVTLGAFTPASGTVRVVTLHTAAL